MIHVCTEAQHECKEMNIEDGHVAKLESHGLMKNVQIYQISGDNLNNVRHKYRRHFRKIKKEYPRDKITELATHSNSKRS
jgi:hypothetical protein